MVEGRLGVRPQRNEYLAQRVRLRLLENTVEP